MCSNVLSAVSLLTKLYLSIFSRLIAGCYEEAKKILSKCPTLLFSPNAETMTVTKTKGGKVNYLCGAACLPHHPRASFSLRLGLFVSDWSLEPKTPTIHSLHTVWSFTGNYKKKI